MQHECDIVLQIVLPPPSHLATNPVNGSKYVGLAVLAMHHSPAMPTNEQISGLVVQNLYSLW